MADKRLQVLMSLRKELESEISKIDKRMLRLAIPEVHKELQNQGTMWLHTITDLAEALPAPRHVVERSLYKLVDQGVAELGFDGMNDTWILRQPVHALPQEGLPAGK